MKLSDVKTGDILLFEGNSVFSELIKAGTNTPYSHVAFAVVEGELPALVFESIETIGVRTTSLASRTIDKITLARHNGFCDHTPDIELILAYAASKLGDPYAPEDIAAIAERIIDHGCGTPPIVINEGATRFICSEYVDCCFRAINLGFKWDCQGYIAPGDIAKDPNVVILGPLDLMVLDGQY